jgi:hypothetical protein
MHQTSLSKLLRQKIQNINGARLLWSRQNKNKTKLVVVSRSGCSTLMEKQQTHTAPTKLTTDAITLRAAPSKDPNSTKNQWHAFAGEQAEQKQNWY